MKLLILSSNNGEGHNSAAKALMEQAEARGISAIIADTLMFDSPRRSERIKKIHVNSALYNPRIFKTGERIAERMANGPYQSAIYYESAGFADRIAKFCSINGVDTVVATHVFAAEAMSYLRSWGMPFKGYFVATDYCYTTFVSDTCLDAYFVPHRDIVADYEKKAPNRLYIPSGIPVSENKIIKTDKRTARERLGLPQDVPILMMMTGSMGFGNVKELTERLLPMMPKDTAIVALCGTNDELRTELEKKYGGKCNLRFDDTNPVKEDVEYVDSIKRDIQWLGFQWELERYASDYFDQLYEWAVVLIKKGLAYVDDQTQDEIRENRGTVSVPGTPSPWRDRSVEENLDLFTRMKNGEFPDGAKVLRAKIDMAHPNMLFRDPIMYRIIHAEHHRTGNKWCIYPMYDYAHGQSDSIEQITHSICTLEFDVHRPLYDWFIQALEIFPSHQYEFARLNLTYTMMSKRKLLKLVQEGAVMGWDDPRMPTICALRRKGYTPASVRNFAEMVGVAKRDNVIDLGKLEYCVREDLNKVAQRRMAVLNPLKVVITNYPEDKEETFELPNIPKNEEAGVRAVPFTRELYIDADDFAEVPPPKFFRMKPDGEVRLMGAYIVKCNEIIKDEQGNIVELHCTADLETGNGNPADGRKIKGTIHWVSAKYAIDATVRLYDYLFTLENVNDVPEGTNYLDYLNPNSLTELHNCKLEPALAEAKSGDKFQFVRTGYFCKDSKDEGVFNQIVGLKDSWAKEAKK